ncbi:MAG: zinc-binding dehydrogenase [Planctomycetia bacterium]|nr:zinc-binding dehydrogenase [Planctomycetia bacterium]
MTHSLAAVFDGSAGEIELREFPLPHPHEGEILVRVLGCTLCASDRHSFEGRRVVPVPTVLGHEIVGEIVELGPAAPEYDLAGRELRLGDRVAWAIVAACGECLFCRRGLPQKCERGVKYGHERLGPGRELLGGLAQHCLLVRGTSIVRLPEDVPLAVACPAGCATATIAAALESAGELWERNVCVMGAGMLGLTAVAMSRSCGAAEVVCVDPHPFRRDQALSFGATSIVSPDGLADAMPAGGGPCRFDVVLEISGQPAAFHAAWPLIRTGGTLVLVGSVFPSEAVPVSLEQIVRRHLTIRGVHNYAPRHLLRAVEFLASQQKSYPFDSLVRRWYPLAAVRDAFAASANPENVRVGVDPTLA